MTIRPGLLPITLLLIFTTSGFSEAKEPQMVASTAHIEAVDCPNPRQAVLGEIAAAIATKAVGAGINFIAEWFSSIEERRKAQDIANAHGGLFDCIVNGTAGRIVYQRGVVSGSSANSDAVSSYLANPHMVFRGDVRAIEALAKDGSRIYKVWVEPRTLILNEFIGQARGKIDLAVTITLEIPSLVVDKEGKTVSSTVHALDPILFRGIEEGTAFNFPSDIAMATGAVTFVSSGGVHPVSVKVVVDEVPAGAGSKLIASIYKAVGESLKEQNEAINAKLIQSIFGAGEAASDEETSN